MGDRLNNDHLCKEAIDPASLFTLISELIRYERCFSCYDDFGYRHKLAREIHLKNCYDRYPDLIRKYQRSVKDMMVDSFPD